MNRIVVSAFVVVVSACSGSDGGPPADGATMTGSTAFVATSTAMLTEGIHCTSGELASGKLAALTVVISDVDLTTTSCPDGDFDRLPHVLQLGLATGGYFTADPEAANEAIFAGTTFTILNENVTDEDLCGNVPAGTTGPTAIAILNECADGSSCAVNYFASAGTVTVSTISGTSVSGTFDLTLSNEDGESQGTLSGSFGASTCD